jgi:carbon monoxide dehydrogenase subunit G
MITVSTDIHINRALQDVWDYVTETGNAIEWQAGVIEASSDGELALGVAGTFKQKFMGREIDSTTECIAFEPPTRVAWQTTGGPIDFVATNEFMEMGDGTHFTITVEGEPGGFFKVAEGMVAKQLEGSLDKDLATLKSILEG